jgi:hypothetical protein
MAEIKLGVGVNTVESAGTVADITVLSPHDPRSGQPYCASHALKLTDLAAKVLHVAQSGNHYVGWLCPDHGLEALA